MKLAIVGKGGVGKTTIAGTLARLFARDGYRVIAVDADPSLNLASSLGIPQHRLEEITPLAENIELIRSRTSMGYGLINLTPRVDDIVEKYSLVGPDGVRLLVMGTVKSGGTRCLCPENAFLRALLAHLILGRKDMVILDMVAGLEHMARGTARGVDLMLCVVEPSMKAVETATRIKDLARDIEVRNVAVVGNKVRTERELKFLETSMKELALPLLEVIPYDESIIDADFKGRALLDYDEESKAVKALIRLKNRIIRDYFACRG